MDLKTARQTAAISPPNTRILARSWIEAQVPPGALFATEYYTPNWTHRPIVAHERSTPYYDLRWYVDYDYIYIITSSAIADWYLKDPDRFSEQARFYENLKART